MASKREDRGENLVLKGYVKPVDSSRFLVRSSSSDHWYAVEWKGKRWMCTCDDFLRRRRKCKHIYAVCYFLTLRDIQAGVEKLGSDECRCPSCEKDDMVIKDGMSESKSGLQQRFYCKRCDRSFTARTGFNGMHGQALAILLSLDLYYRGLSLRQIAEHLQSVYGIIVSHGTIYGWIKRYISVISEYLNNLSVKVGERWHADDTLVRVKGKHLRLWGMLDSETRLLIASHISSRRSADEAYALLEKGLRKSQTKPLEIVTDGANEYTKAVSEAFNGRDQLIHVQAGISTPLSNNKMERFFRTLKQRYKVINSFYSCENAETFMDGFQAYYNFVRGHRGLNGLTPAQAAGIIDEKLSWINLINLATQYTNAINEVARADPSMRPHADMSTSLAGDQIKHTFKTMKR